MSTDQGEPGHLTEGDLADGATLALRVALERVAELEAELLRRPPAPPAVHIAGGARLFVTLDSGEVVVAEALRESWLLGDGSPVVRIRYRHRDGRYAFDTYAVERCEVAPPLTLEEARAAGLMGWNIRCNICGSFGAEWLHGERPGWGALAVCPEHKFEHMRLKLAMTEFRRVRFEQPRSSERLDGTHRSG